MRSYLSQGPVGTTAAAAASPSYDSHSHSATGDFRYNLKLDSDSYAQPSGSSEDSDATDSEGAAQRGLMAHATQLRSMLNEALSSSSLSGSKSYKDGVCGGGGSGTKSYYSG